MTSRETFVPARGTNVIGGNRIKERALAAAKLRMEMEKAREVAKAKEEDRRKEAEEHREMLRARAGTYRADKELAKTSFYTR